jgi:hypothetical protein
VNPALNAVVRVLVDDARAGAVLADKRLAAADGKLKDHCSLATSEQGDQHFPSIGELKRIVVAIGTVDVTKSRNAEAGALSEYPPVIESDLFVESQFGARQEADRHVPIVLGGKAACRRTSETRRDEFFADLSGARLDGVQLLSRGRASAL